MLSHPRYLLGAMVLVLAMVATGCGYGPGSARTEQELAGAVLDRDADLIAATTAVPTGFDPHRERTSGERVYYFPVFDRLTRSKAGGEIVPMLAESWQTAPDALSMRMSLRKHIEFHDGTPFDATALVASITRAQQLDGSVVAPFLTTLDHIEILADHEVIFHYTAPTPDMPTVLAGPAGAMISPAALADPDRDLRVDPGTAGTGPYVVDRFVPSQSVRYVRAAESNWDPEAGRLSTLEIRFIADDRTRDSAIRAGEIDVSYVNSVVAQAVQQARLAAEGSTLRLVEVPTSQLAALWVQSERLTDPRVREALVRAIDRDAIAEGYYQGACAPSAQLTRKGFPGYVGEFTDPYPYDPAKARELAAAAGWKKMEITYTAGREALPVIAADNLAAIGVDTVLRPGTSVEALTAFRTVQTDSFMYSIQSEGTVADTVKWTLADARLSYDDPELAALARRASRTADPQERRRVNTQLVTALAEAAIFVPICHYNTFFLTASDVVGFDQALNGDSQFMMDLRYVGRVGEAEPS
ncbi:ABC transporter substrate-binding protein [Nocardia carnea]|uniref:ABC transporter substrate-binding protein n=1 Tax=Nocardia carnea TaxID=37328 RepID=UPI002453FABA|nr:ABC transporter substrate-binding protein [Nocardia carnea]